ncbi:hypothetical protein ACOMCU_24675 [Lysinibacillus sp. UGB7]|uniref:hypothetical protein n=1 Tax=Lysinibacillus sp. UGB7 TaxID=3411039 RepID=UPI003B79358C
MATYALGHSSGEKDARRAYPAKYATFEVALNSFNSIKEAPLSFLEAVFFLILILKIILFFSFIMIKNTFKTD